jgi:hypothetical protein
MMNSIIDFFLDTASNITFNPIKLIKMAKEHYDDYNTLVLETETALLFRNQVSRFLTSVSDDKFCSLHTLKKTVQEMDKLLDFLLRDKGLFSIIEKNQNILNDTIELYKKTQDEEKVMINLENIKTRVSPKKYREQLQFLINKISQFLNIVYLEDQYLKNDTCILPRKIKKHVSPPSEDIVLPDKFINRKKDIFLPDEFY